MVRASFLFLLFSFGLASNGSFEVHRQSSDPNVAFLKNTTIHSVYLTWETPDTATTMTVNYLTSLKGKNPLLFYGTGPAQKQEDYTFIANGAIRNIAGTPLYIHSFALTNLKPNTEYHFSLGDDANGWSEDMKFTTLPDDSTPIEFVQGGDLSVSQDVIHLAAKAVTASTKALLIGGDIAYENGDLTKYKLWLGWFKLMNTAMRSPDGRLLPLVAAIGNHEVNKKSASNPLEKAPFYLSFFPNSSGVSYFSLHFGSHTDLMVLDTGHIAPHGGAQSQWLKQQLQNSRAQHKLALYHVTLYPSHRDFNDAGSVAGRKHWLPIFDETGLTAAFENHEHMFKRTKLLHGNTEVESKGTVYVGDGCWGVGERKASKRWYHEKLSAQKHLWRVRADQHEISFTAIDKGGKTIDNFSMANGQVQQDRL